MDSKSKSLSEQTIQMLYKSNAIIGSKKQKNVKHITLGHLCMISSLAFNRHSLGIQTHKFSNSPIKSTCISLMLALF